MYDFIYVFCCRYDLPLGNGLNVQSADAATEDWGLRPLASSLLSTVFNGSKINEPSRLSAMVVKIAVLSLGEQV